MHRQGAALNLHHQGNRGSGQSREQIAAGHEFPGQVVDRLGGHQIPPMGAIPPAGGRWLSSGLGSGLGLAGAGCPGFGCSEAGGLREAVPLAEIKGQQLFHQPPAGRGHQAQFVGVVPVRRIEHPRLL